MLTSEWDDDDFGNFHASKVNTHWHFLQFDNQSSDGVITGFRTNSRCARSRCWKKDGQGLCLAVEQRLRRRGKKGDRVITPEERRAVSSRHRNSHRRG